jgi:hypothetical protein
MTERLSEADLSPRQRALAGEFVKEGHDMQEAINMAAKTPREIDAKQRFLGALDEFIGVRIEQHERHGPTVPTRIVDRWQASGVNLAVALDNLLEAKP